MTGTNLRVYPQELADLQQRWLHSGPMCRLIFDNFKRWVNLRKQCSNNPAYVEGVWLDATRADPIGLLRWQAPAKKRKRRFKSISGWIPYKTVKTAGTLAIARWAA
jgi:hypothetical protein